MMYRIKFLNGETREFACVEDLVQAVLALPADHAWFEPEEWVDDRLDPARSRWVALDDYPEGQSDPAINALTLPQVRAALNLALANLNALKPEARPGLAARIKALRDRERRLIWTRDRRDRIRSTRGGR